MFLYTIIDAPMDCDHSMQIVIQSARRCIISLLIYIQGSMLNISEYSLRCVIMCHVQSMPRALVYPWGDLGALARQMLL